MKFRFTAFVLAAAIALSGCTRITTGEVGVRIDASRQVQGTELLPGSWNQTLIGTVLEFPVRDIVTNLENKMPLTSEGVALKDFDVTFIYNINPSSVAELYSTKSKSFHGVDSSGDILLMQTYIATIVNNAAYKVVRGYKQLEVADKRSEIEMAIRENVLTALKEEKLDGSIQFGQVAVRNIAPNEQILQSATDLIKKQNELKQKQTEVEIAEKEAERMKALADNSGQSIAYMEAQAKLIIAEAVKNGKVQTIIIPSNMTGLMLSK